LDEYLKKRIYLRKTKLLTLIFLLTFVGLATTLLLNGRADAQPTHTSTPQQTSVLSQIKNVTVEKVEHVVQILQSGSVAINDTVQLSATNDTTLSGYPLGFPYKYSHNLAYVYAFNTSKPTQMFNVLLDTGLGTNAGYYGVTVIFPKSGVQLYGGSSFRFTVAFVFSDLVISSTNTYNNTEVIPAKLTTEPILTMYYPMFPSLLQNASVANVTVITPPNTRFEAPTIVEGVNLTAIGTGQEAYLISRPLPALASPPASWLNFSVLSGSVYQLLIIDNLQRQVGIDGQGGISVAEAYTITSQNTQAVSSMELSLPAGANSLTAYDVTGNSMATTLVNKSTATYSLSFSSSLQPGNSTQFTLSYHLPSGTYVTRTGSSGFDLNLPITQGLGSVVGKLTLKVSLPEGSSIEPYPSFNGYELQNGALQQSILFTAYNVSSYNNLSLQTNYVYSVFWFSFLPTLWMSALVSVAVVVALIWERPKLFVRSTAPTVAAKPQTLKSIASSYEQRARISREIESIESQVQKGRMPRARYKTRRRMLESQLNRVDRELVELKERVKSVGPKYAELLKELDIAEAELEGVNAEAKRVEAKYKSGTISLDTYKHQQDQLNKRREKAKTTIDGALLRLGEETA
jgi:hypothetical protein